VETLTPGHGTPIHRHELEEIFIIVKGSGTVYVAPESKKKFPREPEAFPFASNSTFSVPFNLVH
jgi:mannose-6-phosphate isomerase-like protein (cupin superfamily)